MALNLSNKEINILRNRVYQGYKGYDPKEVDYPGDWGMSGVMETRPGINYAWYQPQEKRNYGWADSILGRVPSEESILWGKVAKELGIKVDTEDAIRRMYDYVLGYKPPAPAPAPAPAVSKTPPTPTTPTNTYQTQINQLQANLNKTIADAQASTKSYESLINDLKIGFGNQLATAQANYNTQTQELIKKYGLEIGGLKTNFANQFAQQASAYDTKIAQQASAYDTKIAQQAADFKTRFEGQEASFAERLAKQQKGFDVSMANQSIAGRAPNLQIGSSQTGSPQQGGTAGFRRRPVQFNIPAYAGLSINSGNINI